ncbi:MAG: hypothetical protein ACK5NN_16100 [Sphingomonadaceae bacterium]
MRYFKHLNPTAGASDFWSEFKRPTPYRWPIIGVSMLLTFCLMYAFTQERVYIPPERPQITYITSFAPGRTDEEIRQSNIENQKLQDRLQAEQEERIERRKEIYRALGRATGLDVDEMERKIAEDEARENAAAEEKSRQLTQPANAGEGQVDQPAG